MAAIDPVVVALINNRLRSVSKQVFTGASVTSPGTAGSVPAPQAGPVISVLTSDGVWTAANITLLNTKSFTAWTANTTYAVAGIYLVDAGRLYRVLAPHFSSTIGADLLANKIEEIGGNDDMTQAWTAGVIFKKGQAVSFNGQLVQAQLDHISTTFAADCANGLWRFIANASFSTTATGANYYSFIGHVVLKDGRLWVCITPHPAATWQPQNWLNLQRDYVGATAQSAGTAGQVTPAAAGQQDYAYFGDGTWRDIIGMMASGGPNASTAAALNAITTDLTAAQQAIAQLQNTVIGLSSSVTTIQATEALGVNPNIISANTAITAAYKGLVTAVDTSSVSVVLTLPVSPAVGDTYSFTDAKNTWFNNPVTVASTKVAGTTQIVVLDVNGATVTFKYVNATTGWMLQSD
jgi:hypothetical protein